MKMTKRIRQADSVTIVEVGGRLELGEESAALRETLCDLLAKGHKQFGIRCLGQRLHQRAKAGWRTETLEPDR